MLYRLATSKDKSQFNQAATHPLQSWAWGKFREKTGIEVIRIVGENEGKIEEVYQLTLHPIPKLPLKVGYLPRSVVPSKKAISFLAKIGKENKVIFIKLEPNVSVPIISENLVNQSDLRLTEKENAVGEKYLNSLKSKLEKCGLKPGKSLFTTYSFQADLTKSEEELMNKMKNKTRYNVRYAQKKGVTIIEDSTLEGFEEYLKLLRETTQRQGFYAHGENYQRHMWKTMHPPGIAKLLKATYQNKILAAWIVFIYNDTIYYPYGTSSNQHRNVQASSLMMWEIMKLGKQYKCKTIDMWGALGPKPNESDPWYGFHRFKEGYGTVLHEFVGTYDLILNHTMYNLFQVADTLRWKILRARAR